MDYIHSDLNFTRSHIYYIYNEGFFHNIRLITWRKIIYLKTYKKGH